MPPEYRKFTEAEQVAARYLCSYASAFEQNPNEVAIAPDSLRSKQPSIEYILPDIEMHLDQLCANKLLQHEGARGGIFRLTIRNIGDILGNTPDMHMFINSNLIEILKRIPIEGYAQLDAASDDPGAWEIRDTLRIRGVWENVISFSKAYAALFCDQATPSEHFRDTLLSETWCPLDAAGDTAGVGDFIYYPVTVKNLIPERDFPGALFLFGPDIQLDDKAHDFRQALTNLQAIELELIPLIFILTPAGETLKISAAGFKWAATFLPCDVLRICLDPNPKQAFCLYVLEQIDISIISPYTGENPARGNMFFGRGDMCKRVLAHPDQNFALYGPRRSGKTSLLWKIHDLIGARNSNLPESQKSRAVYVDATLVDSGSELAKLLAIRSKLPEVSDLNGLAREIRKAGGRYEFLIDEIDELISKEPNLRVFHTLRALSNEGLLRVVVAGFAELYRLANTIKHPAFNFLERIHLFELDDPSAQMLATEPMRSLGVEYEVPGLVKQLLDRVSRFPALVQYACGEIVDQLSRERSRKVMPRHVESARRGRRVTTFINTVVFANLSSLARLVLLLNLTRAGFTERSALESVRKYIPSVKLEQIEEELRTLEVLGVVRPGEGKSYVFILPQLPDLIKIHHDVDFMIGTIAEELRGSNEGDSSQEP